jgi:hypothetical protein
MRSKDFDTMRFNLLEYSILAQHFAAQLDTDPNTAKSARAWFALADRLFEAVDQADNMSQVITPLKA